MWRDDTRKGFQGSWRTPTPTPTHTDTHVHSQSPTGEGLGEGGRLLTSPGTCVTVTSQGKQPWPPCLRQSVGPFRCLGRERVHDEARRPRTSPRQHSSQQFLVLLAAPLLGNGQGLAGA